MAITAIALFGSLARGDQDAQSDTDLLMITTENSPRHVKDGSLSLSFYPFDDLLSRAQNGDLFVCHIVSEARAFYDPSAELEQLRAAFRLRTSYEEEITHASDLGWFLYEFGEGIVTPSLVSRRIAWCVRTILISRSAEKAAPVFSASALAAFAGSDTVLHLIKQKTDEQTTAQTFEDLRWFLSNFANERPFAGKPDMEAYFLLFCQTSNQVALGTWKTHTQTQIDYVQ